jgi:two-component system sensor histidine kinase CreC
MKTLAAAMKSMREELDGKTYVESYIQSVTHEFKSPLAGITASVEILRQPLSEKQREEFLNTADAETSRLTLLVERLLELSRLEKQQRLTQLDSVNLHQLVSQLFSKLKSRAFGKDLVLVNDLPKYTNVNGDPFLIEVALSNLLENALAHCEEMGKIVVYLEEKTQGICVYNQGQQIPDYALTRLTERFYALPKPDTGKKSSGLGLNFVAEIASLHQGKFCINNTEKGVIAKLILSMHLK